MIRRKWLAAGLVATFWPFVIALAQTPAPAPVNVYGVVKSAEQGRIEVTDSSGAAKSFTLKADLQLFRARSTTIADIRPNDFVASAAVPKEDGTLHSTELRIFPEAMRGVGEGQRPMNDARQQMMTNATVTGPATSLGGDRIKVAFPGGEAVLVIAKDVPVVRIEPASPADMKPGIKVRLQGGPDQQISRITIQQD